MPIEYFPDPAVGGVLQLHQLSTSSTREGGRPGHRGERAQVVAPRAAGCAPATSRFAPTVRAGSSRSA